MKWLGLCMMALLGYAREVDSRDGGEDAIRHWCAFPETRLVACRQANGTESFITRESKRCWQHPYSYNCGRFRTHRRTRYITVYKPVKKLVWKCCQGFTGPNCDQAQNYVDTPNQIEQVESASQSIATVSRGQSTCTCPPGSPGAPGPRGLPGHRGRPGDRGHHWQRSDIQGIVREYLERHPGSTPGERGEQGPRGPKGDKGEVGDRGSPGPPGDHLMTGGHHSERSRDIQMMTQALRDLRRDVTSLMSTVDLLGARVLILENLLPIISEDDDDSQKARDVLARLEGISGVNTYHDGPSDRELRHLHSKRQKHSRNTINKS